MLLSSVPLPPKSSGHARTGYNPKTHAQSQEKLKPGQYALASPERGPNPYAEQVELGLLKTTVNT